MRTIKGLCAAATAVTFLTAISPVKSEAAPLSDFFLGTATPYGGQQARLPSNTRVDLLLIEAKMLAFAES